MSRHVVLLRRDPSLGLALRALLHGTGRVTELGDVRAWPEVAAGSIDAVVVDLPEVSRRKAIDLVRSRFNGRLVVVLDPADDPATVPPRHACSVVQRPFEIVELWQLVTTDPTTGAAPVGEERPAAAGSPEAEGGVPGGSGAPPVERETGPVRRAASVSREREVPPPSPAIGGPATAQAPGHARPPAGDASTWKWRGQRYGPATAIPPEPPGDEGAGGPSGAKPEPPSGDQARARGALPRRSADSRPGGTSARAAGRPGEGSEAADASGGRASDRGAAGGVDPQQSHPAGPGETEPRAPRTTRRWLPAQRSAAPAPEEQTAGVADTGEQTAGVPGTGEPGGATPPTPPSARRPGVPDPDATGGSTGSRKRPAASAAAAGDVGDAAAGGSASRPDPQVGDPAPGRVGAATGSDRPGPWPVPLSTAGSAPDQSAEAAHPAGAGPERPSFLRRLAGRLGGRRPEVEVLEETPTDIRSASVPAFEPPAPPLEGAPQRPTGPPVWPDSAAQSRPAPAEAGSRPSTPPAPRSEPRPAPPQAEPAASLSPKQSTPPPARPTPAPSATPATEPPDQAAPPSAGPEPAATPPTAEPAPAPPSGPSTPERAAGPSPAPSTGSRARGPMRPARPERPTRPTSLPATEAPAEATSRPTVEPSAQPDPPSGPADAASRQRRPSRPAVPADLPPSEPGPKAPPSTRPEPDAPTDRPAPPPDEPARPTREDAAPATARTAPQEQPQPAPEEPAPVAASAPDATAAVPDDPRDAVAAVASVDDTAARERAPTPAAKVDADPAAMQAAATAAPAPHDQAPATAAPAPRDQGAASPPRGPERRRRPDRRRGGEPPPAAAPAPHHIPVEEGDRPRPPQPAVQPQPATPAAASVAEPAAPPPAASGEQEPEAAGAKARPGSGPLGVPPDAPEALLAAEEVADAPPGPMPGTFAHPPGTAPPGAGGAAAGEGAPERRSRTRRARNLLRFTAPRRPESTEREAPVPDAAAPPPLADFDRLTASIESVTEALGGQPLEFYERDLPQIAAAETARRIRADVVVLLLDNGEGLMEVSGGVGLTPAERRLSVEYSRDVMRELFRAGVGLIEDTDRVRGALAGIPGSRAETLVMVPLVHERLGFGVLMAGRNRSQTGVPTEVFADAEIEVLMGFADAAAASLRTAVLLRHLKGQLRALEEEG